MDGLQKLKKQSKETDPPLEEEHGPADTLILGLLNYQTVR